MRKREAPRRCMDMISNLPTNVVEIILARMPIRDAVRTSILSKKWRYLWVSIPRLVMDNSLCGNKPFNKKDLFSKIHQILLLHCGPILEFTLSITGLKSCSEIDQLILYLSRHGLEKLSLIIWDGGLSYKLSSSFFSCSNLTHLRLFGCRFEPPTTFEGFSRLISLGFSKVIFDHKAFGKFVSSCPLIEELTLIDSEGFDAFEFDSPTLKFLCVRGKVGSVCLKSVPLLSTLSIATLKASIVEEPVTKGATSSLIGFFSCLPAIENLHVDSYFLKSLTADGLSTTLLSFLNHLRILKFSKICLSLVDEVLRVLCLIGSAPNLREISIEMHGRALAHRKIHWDFSLLICLVNLRLSKVKFKKLQQVKMQYVSGTDLELELIKLFFMKSPVLVTMLIKPQLTSVEGRLELLKKLTRFTRTSSTAQIIFDDSL